MAWETRNGRGRYYTRSRRVNGRVVREYIGNGPAAELIAAQCEERHRMHKEGRAVWNGHTEDLERTAALVERCWEGVSELTAAVLASAGFYRHHRGEWRKRRV